LCRLKSFSRNPQTLAMAGKTKMVVDNRFSELWCDQRDADQSVMARAGNDVSLAEALRSFVRNGYAVLEGAVDEKAIDRYRDELARATLNTGLLASYGPGVFPLSDSDPRKPLTKILDTYMLCPAALDLMFSPPVHLFMSAVFEDAVLAFQGLHFEVGSTQTLHQDTAYVVVDVPLNLAASWIALEDIQEGAGELAYIPGSHRFAHFLYSGGRKHWDMGVDGNEPHDRHLRSLQEQAALRGIAVTKFRPRKGDVFIWHADLAHGGAQITQPGATRRSLVTHYCPARNTPHYFRLIPEARRRKIPVGIDRLVSTFYYDLIVPWG
jgi:phytanoyl-CoA hydroxylase